MADTTAKIAKNLERFAQACGSRTTARTRPTPPTASALPISIWSAFQLEEGEEILPGITIHVDGGVSGNFRVLCDGEHDEGLVLEQEQDVDAVRPR